MSDNIVQLHTKQKRNDNGYTDDKQMLQLANSIITELHILLEERQHSLAREFSTAAISLLNTMQETEDETKLVNYITKYPSRKDLPHWQVLFDDIDTHH